MTSLESHLSPEQARVVGVFQERASRSLAVKWPEGRSLDSYRWYKHAKPVDGSRGRFVVLKVGGSFLGGIYVPVQFYLVKWGDERYAAARVIAATKGGRGIWQRRLAFLRDLRDALHAADGGDAQLSVGHEQPPVVVPIGRDLRAGRELSVDGVLAVVEALVRHPVAPRRIEIDWEKQVVSAWFDGASSGA